MENPSTSNWEHSKKALKWTYKVVRSVLFTAIIVVASLIALILIAIQLPPVQNYIKEEAAKQLAIFLNSDVEVGSLSIIPLNEIVLNDAVIYDQQNEKCLTIGKLGAAINLWRLLFGGKIEVTYVELLDFKGAVYQNAEDEPFNIDFIIKAFEPKDKNKPPTQFDLKIHNIVLRGGEISFDKKWIRSKDKTNFDTNHIAVSHLSADLTLPRISNEEIEIDLRRLSFDEKSGLQIKDIGGFIKITPDEIAINNLTLNLPGTALNFNNFTVPKSWFIKDGSFSRNKDQIEIMLQDSYVTPSNFEAFYPPLSYLNMKFPINLNLKGNLQEITIKEFEIGGANGVSLLVNANINNFLDEENLSIEIDNLAFGLETNFGKLLENLLPTFKAGNLFDEILNAVGEFGLNLKGGYDKKRGSLDADVSLVTQMGNISILADGTLTKDLFKGNFNTRIDELELKDAFPELPLQSLQNTSIDIEGEINFIKPESSNGNVDITIGKIDFLDRSLSSIDGNIRKVANYYGLDLNIADTELNLALQAEAQLAGENSHWKLWAKLDDFDTYNSLLSTTGTEGYELKGSINLDATGNTIDNMAGRLEVNDLSIKNNSGKQLDIDHLNLTLANLDDDIHTLSLRSEMADVDFTGKYQISRIPGMIKQTLGEVCPALFPKYYGDTDCGRAEFSIHVKDANPLIDFFKIPVIPLTALNLSGYIDSDGNKIELASQIPYIQQGKNKLITDTYFNIDVTGESGEVLIHTGTVYPTKKGLLKLDVDLLGNNGEYKLNIGLNRGRNVIFFGDIAINLLLDKDPEAGELSLIAQWLPGELHINDDIWSIEESQMVYNLDGLRVEDFCIRHADQFIFISGKNYKNGEGELNVDLSDINLETIFETLNIPNVTFGGNATGGAVASGIFTSDPDIHTEGLVVKNLSYNGGVVGDGDIYGRLNLKEKMVEIGAKVREGEKLVADVEGGVWFGRDSLSFNFDAHSVNIAFMQPFMAAFSSEVKGRASGKALLFGTFSDIDMKGTIAAEEASIKIDYINSAYTGSDTVYMTPGKILLPDFKIKDKFGNTATVNGVLTHRQFHDPVFQFTISDMENLLVYDTNAMMNTLWYGKIFASGAGEVNGKPGSVNILADVQTEKGSDFYFILSDQQEAVKSHFLTFTDRKKEALTPPKEVIDSVPEFLKKFQAEQKKQEDERKSIYSMDFRVSVTPEIKFNLIMDPVGGDKITSWGSGAMNLTYSSLTDELKIYGKYILEKGNYNFTLQDIIIKDFTIKPGSSIAFTGNPYNGILDITAAYKVNTSLTELDQSFANDRELNRTSVPVEALLKVTGPLTSPQIGFDIDLPTVTEETAQKVRSIISTDDMMSRQVLFLVALNKFYPPEYMSTSTSGGEWASIASSTISSQIQNAIGQITDKFTLAPSIRSDKGDFSDIEVDVALSSQLFNNRLLINGNIGYRDPSNSSTTFVGDFDIEYLLTNKGNWRLKAYNHFNDQNYYLKSALTTQGLGIVWRKEFGKPSVAKPDARKPEEDQKEIKEEPDKE